MSLSPSLSVSSPTADIIGSGLSSTQTLAVGVGAAIAGAAAVGAAAVIFRRKRTPVLRIDPRRSLVGSCQNIEDAVSVTINPLQEVKNLEMMSRLHESEKAQMGHRDPHLPSLDSGKAARRPSNPPELSREGSSLTLLSQDSRSGVFADVSKNIKSSKSRKDSEAPSFSAIFGISPPSRVKASSPHGSICGDSDTDAPVIADGEARFPRESVDFVEFDPVLKPAKK